MLEAYRQAAASVDQALATAANWQQALDEALPTEIDYKDIHITRGATSTTDEDPAELAEGLTLDDVVRNSSDRLPQEET
jgi:hypothetical protein